MGATEILKILSKGNELTSIEIAEQSDCSVASIQQSIKRLVKDVSENVKVRTLTNEEKREKYGRVIGCKVFVYCINE